MTSRPYSTTILAFSRDLWTIGDPQRELTWCSWCSRSVDSRRVLVISWWLSNSFFGKRLPRIDCFRDVTTRRTQCCASSVAGLQGRYALKVSPRGCQANNQERAKHSSNCVLTIRRHEVRALYRFNSVVNYFQRLETIEHPSRESGCDSRLVVNRALLMYNILLADAAGGGDASIPSSQVCLYFPVNYTGVTLNKISVKGYLKLSVRQKRLVRRRLLKNWWRGQVWQPVPADYSTFDIHILPFPSMDARHRSIRFLITLRRYIC